MIKKICPVCEKNFITYPSINQKTCSFKCMGELRRQQTYERNKRNCKICKKEFVPKHPKTPGLFCSYKCMGKANRKAFIVRSGYKYLHLPRHPNATKQGYFAEHRYIMEKYLGRLLQKKEIVHHINHNKTDNRIKNLMLFSSPGGHFAVAHLKKRNKQGQFSQIQRV